MVAALVGGRSHASCRSPKHQSPKPGRLARVDVESARARILAIEEDEKVELRLD